MDTDFLLQVRDLSKSFPGVEALRGVHLDVRRGEVHAVMGENGAGKSTLMRILIGLDSPDTGEIRLRRRVVRFRGPHEALQAGLSMIHQELLPFLDLTVAENVMMGREPIRCWPGWIDRRALNREAQRWLDHLGLDLAPTTRMRALSVAEMQAVEIAKALAYQAQLIIMDEPTSALSARESEALLQTIRSLRQKGVAILYVSHRLDEVFRLADRVTVLRDGVCVASRPTTDLSPDQLIALMVGRGLDLPTSLPGDRPAETRDASPPRRDSVLTVRGLSRAGRFCGIDFDLHRGEVLGLAGLMGAGRTEILHALYGLAPAERGDIRVGGRIVSIRSPRDALAAGIALVAEDRKRHGLVPTLPVKHNLTLADLWRCCRGPLLDPIRENQIADARIRSWGIKTRHRQQPVGQLSGGNQQKVVLAKALALEPSVVLLDEPTRGIDIGAKQEVYRLIRQWAQAGKAVLLVSSELPELLRLSDRVLVLCQGRLTAEFRATEATPEMVLRHAMPSENPPHA